MGVWHFPTAPTRSRSQPSSAGACSSVRQRLLYSLDAASGCVYWSFEARAGIRTAPSVGPTGAVFFGDIKGNVYAVNASTATLILDQTRRQASAGARDGAPGVARWPLYVPVASIEEAAGGNPTYECCTFPRRTRGLRSRSGEEIWRSYTIPEAPKPTKRTQSAPSSTGRRGGRLVGADHRRRAGRRVRCDWKCLHAARGGTSDSVLAFDLKTGKLLWASQVQAGDAT
jgi:polyvinyl alcohol dehydrogenase (cytochrome)